MERRLPPGLPARLAVLCVVTLWSVASTHAQRFSAPTVLTTGNDPTAVVAADFTGKGVPELLALDSGSTPLASSVRVLPNTRGAFSLGAELATAGSTILAMPTYPGAPPGLYWTSLAGNQVTLFHANAQPDGSYLPGTALTTFPLSGSAIPRLLLAAAGLHDSFANSFLVADTANNQLYTVLPEPDGTYAIMPVPGMPGTPLLPGATQLLTADLNGDGLPDLLVAGAGGVQVFLAYGGGSASRGFIGFAPSTTYPCAGSAQSLALADMDGDSHPDLLVEAANGQIDIYHGNADGTFAPTSEVGTGLGNPATGNGGHLVGVADLNADGVPDLVLANPQGITVLLGTGGRSFQLSATYALPSTPTSFVFADLNGDGKPDIAFDSPQGVAIMYSLSALTGQLTASPEPSPYGSDITLTLSLNTAAPVPTGTVSFSVDGAVVGTAPVTGPATAGASQATYTIAAPMDLIGQHALSAAYSGDAVYSPATFTGTHAVVGLPTATTVASLVTPIFYGQEIGYTNGIDAVVSVAAASSGAPPAGATLAGGEIDVTIDGNLVCVLTQGASGPSGNPQRCPDANFMGFPAGTHILVASYQGNQYYAPSNSVNYPVVIQPDATASALTSSQNPAPFGTAVTFTATLSALYATPTGTVTFLDGMTPIGSGLLNANGVATFTTSTLAIGSHPIVASYAATQNFDASQSSLTEVIEAISATTLTSSLNPSSYGQTVTFTATVALNGLSTAPSGTVLFTDSGATLGLVPVNAQGVATYTTSALAVGQHPIVAAFTPTSNNILGSSASLTQVVTAAVGGTDFTLTVDPANLSIGVGSTGNVTVTVKTAPNFTEPVTLSCSGLPYEATCTFVTVTIPSGGGATQLAIHPEAPHNCSDSAQYFIAGEGGWLALALGASAALLFSLRRRRMGVALFAFVLCLLPMLGGCGSGNCTDLATRPGTYSFTVTGTAQGSIAASHSVTMTIRAYLNGEPH